MKNIRELVIKTFVYILVFAMPNYATAENYYADITKVSAIKSPLGSGYSLQVTIKSSDKNCDHYVNWWEAVSENGELLYRRILGHPHSREQPFSRGGVTKSINDETVFYVRAHIHPFGYSNMGMKGSVKNGFSAVDITNGFAKHLANEGEIPSHCDASIDK